MTRRLPIYLLVDCSESMAGEAIEEAQRGVQTMVQALCDDPLAIETAYVSVITFAGHAKQVVPLTEILEFQPVRFRVQSGTALGAALRLLVKCLERDVQKTTATVKGDYKPIVILLTDGQPTDDWQQAADQIKSPNTPKIANIYAVACGEDADTDILRRVTDIVLQMKTMTRDSWRKLFVWLTASVQTTSRALESGGEGALLNLPALPDSLELAPARAGWRDPRPRQVFLHARCSKTRRPYLMRFARRGDSDTYVALCSHPLEDSEDGGGDFGSPTINTAQLDGIPSCPHCESPGACMCDCGTLFCIDGRSESVVCPQCHETGYLGAGRGFDIRQAEG
jgi:uncharacterized protein YegL